MLKIYLPLLALALNVSCSKDDESDSKLAPAPEAPFLTTEALAQPSAVSALSATEVKDELENNRSYFENSDATFSLEDSSEVEEGATEEASADPESKCLQDIYKSTKVKVIDRSKVIFSVSYDLSSCFAEMQSSGSEPTQGAQLKFTESKGLLYGELSCEGSDFSALDGKSITDLEGDTSTQTCATKRTYLLNSSASTKGEVVYGEKTYNFDSTYASAESTADNQACVNEVKDGVYSALGSCRRVDITVSNYNGQTEASFFMTESKDLKWELNKPWFSSGSMSVMLNDWSGTVTYTGSDAAPTYTLTKGGETVSGSFSSTAALLSSKVKAGFARTASEFARQKAQLKLKH